MSQPNLAIMPLYNNPLVSTPFVTPREIRSIVGAGQVCLDENHMGGYIEYYEKHADDVTIAVFSNLPTGKQFDYETPRHHQIMGPPPLHTVMSASGLVAEFQAGAVRGTCVVRIYSGLHGGCVAGPYSIPLKLAWPGSSASAVLSDEVLVFVAHGMNTQGVWCLPWRPEITQPLSQHVERHMSLLFSATADCELYWDDNLASPTLWVYPKCSPFALMFDKLAKLPPHWNVGVPVLFTCGHKFDVEPLAFYEDWMNTVREACTEAHFQYFEYDDSTRLGLDEAAKEPFPSAPDKIVSAKTKADRAYSVLVFEDKVTKSVMSCGFTYTCVRNTTNSKRSLQIWVTACDAMSRDDKNSGCVIESTLAINIKKDVFDLAHVKACNAGRGDATCVLVLPPSIYHKERGHQGILVLLYPHRTKPGVGARLFEAVNDVPTDIVRTNDGFFYACLANGSSQGFELQD